MKKNSLMFSFYTMGLYNHDAFVIFPITLWAFYDHTCYPKFFFSTQTQSVRIWSWKGIAIMVVLVMGGGKSLMTLISTPFISLVLDSSKGRGRSDEWSTLSQWANNRKQCKVGKPYCLPEINSAAFWRKNSFINWPLKW